ncbi:hypothetical protein N7462_001711 [Penicillium macrosclerotiorum]|uniref:uncharacterized protein n=1 Tax=Penicillium macrosclerotiorum TaxID=303699 RepID=UPI0025484EEF|nr:uncharacterized protein N7462_001711 [Penicillium macrosclerotiorum]KAJ5692288.1 hypothetical protein N7462_001711 [Penicillium macrosclerotiorum]
MDPKTQTVAFFGASTGVGLAALKHSLEAGLQCIALCRTPAKLTAIFPEGSTPNLKIVKGDAHDITPVSECLRTKDGKLVDMIISTIGSKPVLSKLSVEDPECCRKGAAIMIEAISQLRASGVTGNPHIVSFSTTGLSRFGRDVPYLMIPLYHVALKVPHEDKRIMEDRFVESGVTFTIVRGSLLTNGETTNTVRVGIEDPKTGRESSAIGYTISREDSGKWITENLILQKNEKYTNKILMITT